MKSKQLVDIKQSKIAINNLGAVVILLVVINTRIYLNFPRVMMERAYTAGWMLSLYITVLAIIGFFFMTKLASKFPGKDFLDISEHVGGKVLKAIVGTVILVFLVCIASLVLREFSEDIKVISFTQTPLSFIEIFFAAGIVIACYAGIEPIIKVALIVVPVIIAGFFFIMLTLSPRYNILFGNLPIFGKGLKDIFIDGIPKVSVFFELIVLFFIAPLLPSHKDFKRVGYVSVLLSGIFLGSSVLLYGSVFFYPTAIENFLPIYQMARLINLGRFFERVESLFMVTWILSALLYLSAITYFAITIFARLLALRYYKPLIFSFIILMLNLSLLPKSLNSAVRLETEYFRELAGMVTFVLPVIVLIAAKVFRKGESKNG